MRFESDEKGFVYLFTVDENGKIRNIYPNDKVASTSWEIDDSQPYLFPDVFTKTPGCKRVVLVIANKKFKLDVDNSTIRRLACAEKQIKIPVMKSFVPGTKFVQQTFCFTQEYPPRIGTGVAPEEYVPKTYEELMKEKTQKEAETAQKAEEEAAAKAAAQPVQKEMAPKEETAATSEPVQAETPVPAEANPKETPESEF